MLIRAYRVTDRMGVAVLKSSAMLSMAMLEGVERLLTTTGGGTHSILKRLLGFILGIFAGIVWVLKKLYALVSKLLRSIVTGVTQLFAGLWWVLRRIGVGFNKVLEITGRSSVKLGGRAGESVAGVATRSMARRSARAEMEVGMAEDPLRAQNRMLSAMVVVVLVMLIAVVIWATSGKDTGTPPTVASGMTNLNSGNNDATVAASDAQNPSLGPSPVPTATDLPEVLQARGSLAYVVRERGQTDIWAVEVGGRTPVRVVASPEDDRDPAWSNNGTRLAYASRQEDGNWDIYIYDLFAGTTTRLTYNLAFEGRPKWSPDDAFLVYEAYQSGTHLDIFVMQADGLGAQTRLGASSDSADFSPAWSPNEGRRIAFVSWREGNQDIYIYDLNTGETVNLTRTPNRHEDYPSWSPDGRYITYSAVEAGVETVFIHEVGNPNAQAEALRLGHMPSWSPASATASSLVFAVDATDSTFITVAPYAGGVATEVIQAPLGAAMPVWTNAPLPPAIVNNGGLPLAIAEPLFTEQVDKRAGDPPYGLGNLVDISGVAPAYLSDQVNDSFNALRIRANDVIGVDFLGTLSDALWSLDYRPQPGQENKNWHRTGRAFSFNSNLTLGFPPPIEIVREDAGLRIYWRVFVRVADEAQTGQLGEPLRRMPWDFQIRDAGDVEAYEEGGRRRDNMPEGYYVDLTRLAGDYGWSRIPAGTDWRANFNARNYWIFVKTDGLEWYEAMREIYNESELGGWVPTPQAGEGASS